MASFNGKDVDNYGGSGAGSFFSLKNDRDVATVRFMYNSVDDIVGHAVHEVEVDGRKRYVNCLREYNEPVDNCPLCAAGNKVMAKFFVPLYNEDSQEIQVWDRGKTFYSKLASLCSRYNPLVSTPFEIERQGKKGEQTTRYETYAQETDGTTLEDLPEIPELLGTLILDKTFEELADFVDYGTFSESEPALAAPRQPARPVATQRRQPAPAGRAATPAAAPARQAPPVRQAPQAPANNSRAERAPSQPRRNPGPSDKF